MKIQGDLHSHSAFAGGARGGGKSKIEREKKIIKRFHDISLFSPLKGVELLGTGDIQFEWWNTFVKKNFIEDKGFFEYNLDVSSLGVALGALFGDVASGGSDLGGVFLHD